MHRLLQLRLGPGEQIAHGQNTRIEIGHPLLSDGVLGRLARPQQDHDHNDEANRDGCANGKREGWRMRQERIGQRLEVGHALLLP
jgi:hypothetical protein